MNKLKTKLLLNVILAAVAIVGIFIGSNALAASVSGDAYLTATGTFTAEKNQQSGFVYRMQASSTVQPDQALNFSTKDCSLSSNGTLRFSLRQAGDASPHQDQLFCLSPGAWVKISTNHYKCQ